MREFDTPMGLQAQPEVTSSYGSVTRQMRAELNQQEGCVVWFTGLSGAGKSTLANQLEIALYRKGFRTFTMDGDNMRQGLCNGLGFSAADRAENIRRIAETARMFVDAGVITLVACISPTREDRVRAKRIIGPESFLEVWLDCPLEVCEKRDVKGLYRKARTGELKQFTGISAPYEPPLEPELVLQTGQVDVDTCVASVIAKMRPQRTVLQSPLS